MDYFREQLSEIRNLYLSLPQEVQQNVIVVLRDRFHYQYEEMTGEEKETFIRYGKKYGLQDPEKLKEYLEEINRIVAEIFPEINLGLNQSI